MCFDIGIVTCGPNEALVISGMCQVNSTETFELTIGDNRTIYNSTFVSYCHDSVIC